MISLSFARAIIIIVFLFHFKLRFFINMRWGLIGLCLDLDLSLICISWFSLRFIFDLVLDIQVPPHLRDRTAIHVIITDPKTSFNSITLILFGNFRQLVELITSISIYFPLNFLLTPATFGFQLLSQSQAFCLNLPLLLVDENLKIRWFIKISIRLGNYADLHLTALFHVGQIPLNVSIGATTSRRR